jgi:hypothetical protein
MVSTERLVVKGKGQGKRQDLLLQRVIIDLVLDIACDLVETAHVCLGLQSIAGRHIFQHICWRHI